VENESDVSGLKRSSQRVGRLYPILLDKNGNVIDGQHRLAADAAWPRLRLDYVCSEKERLLARLVSNVRRRTVFPKEKRDAEKAGSTGVGLIPVIILLILPEAGVERGK
jgi:hypothetical protein